MTVAELISALTPLPPGARVEQWDNAMSGGWYEIDGVHLDDDGVVRIQG